MFGRDLVQSIDAPAPDRLWAKMQFQQPWDLVRDIAGLESTRIGEYTDTNISEWPLPNTIDMRLRKLARLGVLGAVYLVMAYGKFESFSGFAVLPLMELSHPEWYGFLKMTETYYSTIQAVDETATTDYLSFLVPWMNMIGTVLSDDI